VRGAPLPARLQVRPGLGAAAVLRCCMCVIDPAGQVMHVSAGNVAVSSAVWQKVFLGCCICTWAQVATLCCNLLLLLKWPEPYCGHLAVLPSLGDCCLIDQVLAARCCCCCWLQLCEQCD
jgi:hypothetical protein